LGWFITLALYLATIFSVVFAPARPDDAQTTELPVLIAVSVFVLAYATVGALVASRHPRNPVGWFAAIAGLTYASAGASLIYSGEGAAVTRPGAAVLLALSQWQWLVALVVGGPLLVLFFPNGHLPGRRWRAIVIALVAGLVAFVASVTFMPGVVPDTDVQNPFGIAGAGPALTTLGGIAGFLLVAGTLLSFVSVIVRFRRASHLERTQLKWFLFAAAAAVAIGLGVSLPLEAIGAYELSNFVVTVGLSIIPISIGIAVLQRRLYDIDVVINRALVYGALTGILAAAYIGLVFAFQAAIAPITPESDLAIAASTLAVAGLFRPVRARVQRFIDLRFYRRKVDVQRTLERFSGELRDEVDLGALSSRLTGVVAETMQPTHVSLWLKVGGISARNDFGTAGG
jgi:hypothetical protein